MIKYVGCEDMDWINPAQDSDKFRPLVKMAMNRRVA
jgi:hypothetical protein